MASTTTLSGDLSPAAQCLVAAGLQERVLLPSGAGYADRVQSYWCNSAKLHPACIVQPQSTTEVAVAIRALVAADQVFAVRAGGHMNWAGSNNIDNGVTIDLGLLKDTHYDAETDTARIGPGAKWKDVYAELEKHGRTVAGGREAEVGVGGFLLGGGNTFHSLRRGFGCDNVVAYEVVLADGRIVTADADGEQQDLFRVLKGGGNNFGIVTAFTMATMPSSPIWGGYAVHTKDVLPAAAKAIASFTANASEDRDSTLNFTVCYIPRLGGAAVVSICTNVAGVEKPRAFDQVAELPKLMDTLKTSTLQEVISHTSLPTDYYNVWFTLSFKNDATIISKAMDLYNELAKQVQEKVTDGDFAAHISLQPIPRAYPESSVAAGGNMLGLENYPHDAILIQANISVRTAELAEWARPVVREMVQGIRDFAATVTDGICPFLYLNYANPEQAVLESYGKENIEKMRKAAAKYDPNQVFQKLCPGGYKLADVKI
ncbi:hypothetical protein GGR50DRAFT_693361 [Xylaria sp. CBS 124048]|nr:hypothetical protein GGR50DRAFT_693361 [Xylaria sp. CBS 124048]